MQATNLLNLRPGRDTRRRDSVSCRLSCSKNYWARACSLAGPLDGEGPIPLGHINALRVSSTGRSPTGTRVATGALLHPARCLAQTWIAAACRLHTHSCPLVPARRCTDPTQCCYSTCWASGWRDFGNTSGNYTCPATAEARGMTDGSICFGCDRSQCCTPKCGLSGFVNQSTCPAGIQFLGESHMCWSSGAQSAGVCSQSDCCPQTCSGAGYNSSGSGAKQCPTGMAYRTNDFFYCTTVDCSDAECCGAPAPSSGPATCWASGFRDSTAATMTGARHAGQRP